MTLRFSLKGWWKITNGTLYDLVMGEPPLMAIIPWFRIGPLIFIGKPRYEPMVDVYIGNPTEVLRETARQGWVN